MLTVYAGYRIVKDNLVFCIKSKEGQLNFTTKKPVIRGYRKRLMIMKES